MSGGQSKTISHTVHIHTYIYTYIHIYIYSISNTTNVLREVVFKI